MQFDRHPYAIGVRVITVPGISEATVLCKSEEWIMGESGAHSNVFVQCGDVVLPKFLHVTGSKNLGMHLNELMARVDTAVGLLWRVPEIQLQAVASC